MERSSELFCVLDHIFSHTSIALFLLWPSSLIPFLVVIATLSAFVLLLPVIAFFYRPSIPLLNFLVFGCLLPTWDLSFLKMRNVCSSTVSSHQGLAHCLLFLPDTQECICLNPICGSYLQEHLPTPMFPNWSRNSWCSTCCCITYFYSEVLHVHFMDVGDISSVRTSAGREDVGHKMIP